MFETVSSYLSTIFYFVVGLGLLIFIHELGHFLVAKLNGIRVERFSLGFGPRLGVKIGETEYCLSLLPLGGYVKMSGQEDFEEDKITPLNDPKSFTSKSLGARLTVVVAGPLMNLVLPFLLMPLALMLEHSEAKYLSQVPRVLGVWKDSAAEKAGLKKDDVLVSVNGQTTYSWKEALEALPRLPGATVEVGFRREGEILKKQISLQTVEDSQEVFLGIEPFFFIDVDPVIGQLTPKAPAVAAGMQRLDRVLAINREAIRDWYDMARHVNGSQGKELLVTIERGGQTLDLKVTPVFDRKSKKYVLGIERFQNPEYYRQVSYSLPEAVHKGVQQNLFFLRMTGQILKDLVTFKVSYKDLAGPVGIAKEATKAAEKGLSSFLFLLSLLSINLGVLNLLPIPVLDGGHVAFLAYEGIARKPLSAKAKLIAQQVGMVVLLGLMILVTIKDIGAW